MQTIIGQMKAVLIALDAREIPGDGYTRADLFNYCKLLVVGQRRSLGRTKAGSWSVAPSDKGMDSDARVEFIFLPTYIAVATLSKVLRLYPV